VKYTDPSSGSTASERQIVRYSCPLPFSPFSKNRPSVFDSRDARSQRKKMPLGQVRA